VRAAGVEPAQALRPNGFSYQLRLSPLRRRKKLLRRICGLDYPFTLASALGAARLVSTPSPRWGLARDCHFRGFPDFEQFYIQGFPQEHSS